MHIHTIQLNIEKLLGGTVHMDATEFGAYMSLIISAYQTDNNLPLDEKRLARMARVSLKVWRRISPVILEKFTQEDSRWYHEVVQKELVKYKRLSTKNRANALKKNETQKPVGERSQSQTAANISNKNQVTSISKKKVKEKGSRLPNDWIATDEYINFALTEGYTIESANREADKFKDYWIASTSKTAIKKDWLATWRNWIRNNKDRKNAGTNTKHNDTANFIKGISGRDIEDFGNY